MAIEMYCINSIYHLSTKMCNGIGSELMYLCDDDMSSPLSSTVYVLWLNYSMSAEGLSSTHQVRISPIKSIWMMSLFKYWWQQMHSRQNITNGILEHDTPQKCQFLQKQMSQYGVFERISFKFTKGDFVLIGLPKFLKKVLRHLLIILDTDINLNYIILKVHLIFYADNYLVIFHRQFNDNKSFCLLITLLISVNKTMVHAFNALR